CGADDWAVARRMDHRQFFVEMDFLHQRTGGNHFFASDVCINQRSAVYEETEAVRRISSGLHRNRTDQSWTRQHADYFGQRPAGRLVGERIHPGFCSADGIWIDRGDFLGTAAEKSGRGFAYVEEPEFRDRDYGDVLFGIRAVFEHGADSANVAAAFGIHGG